MKFCVKDREYGDFLDKNHLGTSLDDAKFFESLEDACKFGDKAPRYINQRALIAVRISDKQFSKLAEG